MNNKELIINAIDNINKQYNMNLKLGIYYEKINELSKRSVNRIVEHLGEYADIEVSCKNKRYMVELACVENEVDIMILELDEYKNRYN